MDAFRWLVVLFPGVVLGAVFGAVVATWAMRRTQRLSLDAELAKAGADAQARLAAAEARIASREHDVHALEARLQGAIDEARGAGAALADERVVRAGLAAELREERERAGEKLALLTAAREELSAHFKSLAGDALEINRQRMAEQQQGALDQILKPLGEKLVAFEKKVEETYDREAQQRASLRTEVLALQAATLQINEDAKNLTLALKGESKTRGNWGEVVLERVLERSGLVKGREYDTQYTMKDDEGGVSRPDIVVRLPDDKHVVIDSKVSLVAYDSYYAADDEIARAQAGRQHVEGMRRHVKSLGDKNYQGGNEVDSPDFVAMFVPIEPAFSLAASLDPDLFLHAWERKVVIVTPSTLLALLMTVQNLWQRDKQTRNAIEIAEESGKLHDQFVQVLEALQTLGKHLKSAQDAFEQTGKRLTDGNGNVVKRIARLREMGAKTKRQLPPDVLARASDEVGTIAAAPVAAVRLVAVPQDADSKPL
jgi:DNA recombination protein RmuC